MLYGHLKELSRTPYFNPSLDDYLDKLIWLIEQFIEQFDSVPEPVARQIAQVIWRVSKFFTGSTSKRIPYEVVYALKHVLDDLGKKDYAITTALLEEQNYFFDTVEPTKVIKYFISGIDFDVELVQVALPKLYRHKPLYNVALYHELGHFFDDQHEIVKYCLLLDPSLLPEHRHLKEYFSDLFAASYTGYSIHKFLSCLVPDEPESDSHPATIDRLKNIEEFLEGKKNKYIDIFTQAISDLKLPELKIRYVKPDIDDCFNDIRPYEIKTLEEVHGILDSAWEFLGKAQNSKESPWVDINEFEIHRIVNDLVEKSIRNLMIKERWNSGAS